MAVDSQIFQIQSGEGWEPWLGFLLFMSSKVSQEDLIWTLHKPRMLVNS